FACLRRTWRGQVRARRKHREIEAPYSSTRERGGRGSAEQGRGCGRCSDGRGNAPRSRAKVPREVGALLKQKGEVRERVFPGASRCSIPNPEVKSASAASRKTIEGAGILRDVPNARPAGHGGVRG